MTNTPPAPPPDDRPDDRAPGAFIRVQATARNERGGFSGVFGLVNRLAFNGELTAEEDRFRRDTNRWYDAAYPNPSHADPTVYDHELNPHAAAWFKITAGELVERVEGYLDILDRHGVGYEILRTDRPGRIIYEDPYQVVAVPDEGLAVDEERAGRQLRVIGDVVAAAEACGVDIWLRGGWAMDFFLGRVTRDHRDIDWFAWAGDAAGLGEELARRGFRLAPDLTEELDAVKDGEDVCVNLLARDDERRVVVSGGRWAGSPWPEDMLDAWAGRIGELRCLVINPLAQIEIKRMMPVWVPGRPRRAKDVGDIALLQAVLGLG